MATNLRDVLEQKLPDQLPPTTERKSALRQNLEQRLGEPERFAGFVGQQELGPAGMESLGTRFKVNAADTFREKLTAFRQSFPKGELFKDPINGTLLFRPDEATPFAKVDAGMLEEFEPLGDFIDFVAEDLGAITGELALTLRSKGISLIGLLGRLFLGASVGEAVQESGEALAGFQQETPTEIAARAAMKGAFAVAGGTVGKGIEVGVNFVKGAGTVGLRPGALKAMGAAERQDIPQLLPFQASDNPILNKIAGQAAAVLPTVQRRVAEQNAALTARLSQMRNRIGASKIGERLKALHDSVRASTLNQANRIVRRAEASEGGAGLIQGVAEYSERSRLMVNEAYDAARSIETPQFDLTPILDAVDEVAIGTPFPTRTKPRIVQPFGFTTRAGSLTETTGTGRAEGAVSGEVAAVMRDLQLLDPSATSITVNGGTFTATDWLSRIRGRLWDLKTPNPGELVRLEHAQAQSLYSAVTRTLDNPINANPQFVTAWQTARQTAADRFDTFDKLMILRAGKSEAPALLATRLAQPFQVDNLRVLRTTVSNARFGEFQDFFKSNLLRDPGGLTAALNKFDQPTLDILLTGPEQTVFRNIATQIDKLNATGVREVLERQTQQGAIIRDAVLNNDTAQIDELFRMVIAAGGRRSDVGVSIRAAIIDDFWNDVVALPRGQGTEEAVRTALSAKIKALRASGATKFLERGDLKRMLDLRKIKQFLDIAADTGTSMQAGEAVAGVRSLSASAFITILEHIGTGRFLVSRAGQRFFTGFGKTKTALPRLQAVSGALATVLSDIQADNGKEK